MDQKETKLNEKGNVSYVETYFRFETVFKTRMKVPKLNDRDRGTKRNFKIFIEKLVNAPEYKQEFVKFAIYTNWLQDDYEEIRKLIDLPENDSHYVLGIANTCDPEINRYFNCIFMNEQEAEDAKYRQDTDGRPEGVDTPCPVGEKEIYKLGRENEKFMGMLFDHLELEPVFAGIRELPPEEVHRDFPTVTSKKFRTKHRPLAAGAIDAAGDERQAR